MINYELTDNGITIELTDNEFFTDDKLGNIDIQKIFIGAKEDMRRQVSEGINDWKHAYNNAVHFNGKNESANSNEYYANKNMWENIHCAIDFSDNVKAIRFRPNIGKYGYSYPQPKDSWKIGHFTEDDYSEIEKLKDMQMEVYRQLFNRIEKIMPEDICVFFDGNEIFAKEKDKNLEYWKTCKISNEKGCFRLNSRSGFIRGVETNTLEPFSFSGMTKYDFFDLLKANFHKEKYQFKFFSKMDGETSQRWAAICEYCVHKLMEVDGYGVFNANEKAVRNQPWKEI